MYSLLLLVSIVIFLCVIFNRISGKLGIPMLLAFILLGMFFGVDGVIKIPFSNFELSEKICSVALVFIMFSGGFDTNWREAKPIILPAVLLSSAGTVITAFLTGGFCYYILKIGFLESFLIGAVISSTDAASVFSILRSKRLNLKNNTASMLEVESGSNDPFSYMLTIIVLAMIAATGQEQSVLALLASQIFFGVICGVVIALLSIQFLKRFHFTTSGFDAIFIFGVALFAYAAPSLINGNGFLSVYILGLILGNSSINNKVQLVKNFDVITGLMQILIFFLLGLLANPSDMPPVFLPAVAITAFITFVARPVAVFAILSPITKNVKQALLVSWTGFRGAASIVFAIVAVNHPAQVGNDIFHIVFWMVLFSILVQGSLLPLVARKLDMIDDNSDVLKTFNDYAEETPIEFIRFQMKEDHLWVGQIINQIVLPPDNLIVLIIRGTEKIVPDANTMIMANDILVLVAYGLTEHTGIHLTEIKVKKNSKVKNKKISEIPKEKYKLIILIKRDEKVIIPNGETCILENDVLVVNDIL